MNYELKKCDCIMATKSGKLVIADKDKQVDVALRPSLDPSKLVGTCPKCHKIHTIEKVNA